MNIYKLIVIISIVLSSPLSNAIDLDKLKENLKDFHLFEAVNDSNIQQTIALFNPNFSFSDIDYTMHRRSNWQPRTHLKRLITLAIAYNDKNSSFYKSKTLKKLIIGALNYWSFNNFYSDNWWHQDIGIPQSMGPTLIMCESIIPDSTMIKSLEIMDKSHISRTGQNKIWLSGNVFMRELVRGNEQLIKNAADTIKSVVVASKPYEEGIQPDYSFHQHGPQPQFGNYGLHFAEDIVKWMFIFNDTEIAFPTEKVNLMRKFMFEGQQKVVYKGKYETLATGRQIFPEFVNGVKYRGPSSKYELYKKLEYIFNKFDNRDNPKTAPSEYVHFRNSDYSLYRTHSFFSAVRMSSQRVIGGEAGNGENLMGYHLGDGTNLIYRRGDEYHEIFPVWNWKKLPGTTTVQDNSKLPVLTWEGYKNGSHFTGGLKAKNVGITAFKYHRDSLKANKSYVFIDNKIYALGSAISTNRNFEVLTSINQCYKNGEVHISKNNGEISSVWHDSIAYVSLAPQPLKLKYGPQSGSWKKILSWHTDSLITKNIFQLEVNHGIRPQNEKYAYVSVIGVPKHYTEQTIKQETGRILAHNKQVHALSLNQGSTIAITAFEPCEIELTQTQKLIIKSPCIVSLNKQNTGWLVEAVDPTQLLDKLSFGITGKYQLTANKQPKHEENITYFDIELPKHANDKGKKSVIELIKN